MQIISLVAIGISIASVGIMVANNWGFGSGLDARMAGQASAIESLREQLNSSRQEEIAQARTISAMREAIQSMDNRLVSLRNQANLLNDSIANIEDSGRVVITQPRPTANATFAAVTISDGNGNAWTSHYIKEDRYYKADTGSGCNVPGEDCYVRISKTSSPHGPAIAVDTIGSREWGYWATAYSQEFVAPPDGKVVVSGWFLKNDTLGAGGLSYNVLDGKPAGPYNIGFGYSILAVLALSEDPDQVIQEDVVLKNNDTKGSWIYRQADFSLDPGQAFRIGIGRPNDWARDYGVYGAWSDVVVNAAPKQG